MPPPPAETRATRAGKWLLAVVIPASGLALGSLPTEMLIVMSVLAALSCALLWVERSVPTSRASRWVLLAAAVLLAMTVLQVVPLPASLVRSLAPSNADIWERALGPLREPGPAWHPLSLAPSATRVEVLRGFFYLTTFLAALRVASFEHGGRFLVRLVVFSTAVMALSALAHTAVGAERVFGLYRPKELYAYQPNRFSPLLNTNHLAAYLNIGACVALGALLAKSSMPRALSGSALLVLVGTSVWQSSRGATGTLVFGAVLTFALTQYVRRKFESARAEWAILAACGFAAVVLVTIAVSDASSHLLSRDLTKLGVARNAMRLVAASPWFGAGRGGFETVFSSVREGTTFITFTNPEDFVIQWLVEWGLPASVAGAAMLGWALRPQVLLHAVRPAIGVWVAVVVSVLHELVDYHFEVPGITALAAVCVAVVVGSRVSSRTPMPTSMSSARVSALAAVIGTGVAIAFVIPEIGHTLAEERRTLSRMAVDKTVPREEFRDVVRGSMLRYPAEPFLPLMGAVRAQVNGEGGVVPWVARALERNPRFGRAHFVLAQSLGPARAAQARLEYRLAYENDEGLRDYIVREAVLIVDGPDAALELVPDGPSGVAMLGALVSALGPRLPATAVILDQELERRAPGSAAPFRRRAEAAASDAIDGASWCGPPRECVASALVLARELVRREPNKCHAHLLLARLLIKNGETSTGLDGLERAAEVVIDRGECQRQLVNLALDSGQARRADLALDRLVRGGCGSTADCIDLYAWAARFEEDRGHYVRAVRLYRQLHTRSPDRDDVLERIGELGARDGLMADAVDAYTTLAARHPSDPRWPAKIAEIRERARPPVDPRLPTLPPDP